MAKFIILPLCCVFIVQVLQAQEYIASDITIPQKLEFRRANIGWVDRSTYFDASNAPNYFAKKPDDADTARSILYLGPPKKDTFDLNLPNLPKPQEGHLSLRASAHRPLPLFRIQQ